MRTVGRIPAFSFAQKSTERGESIMPRVSTEDVKLAREIDLLTYLQINEPHELVKSNAGEYRTTTHGSLVISNGFWFHNRTQQGGKSALDYLIKMRGMGFVDAVNMVLGATNAPISVEKVRPPPSKAEFVLPKSAAFPTNVVSYLQKRGISPEVINHCLELGILYESRKYQNAVFVGKDERGKARFACLRGTRDGFKCDIRGSDKRYSFSLPAQTSNSRHLACFESPVDLLSHATLQKRGGWQWDGHRLSLGGTTSLALTAFLERNPQITRIMLHIDSDAAGVTAAEKIKAQLRSDTRFRHIRVSFNPPRGAKDYNELLLRAISAEREQKQQPNRSSAEIL